MRFPLAVATLLTGCAYIGDPLPPSLKIPEAVSDVRAEQKGDRIVVEFTPPASSTDGSPLGDRAQSVVLIGEAGAEPETEASRSIDARPWIGKEVVIGVRTRGPSGRWSAWSNFVKMPVRLPLQVPAALRAASTPEGISLTWESTAPQHRIYRDGELLAEIGAPSYFDTTAALGRAYEYAVEAVDGPAVSERPATVRAAREDRFPPEPPTGLTALAGVTSIELAWDVSTAPDLAFYRVYRNGKLLAREVGPAAFSDVTVQSGVSYRYAVSAVDRNGNESAPSATVEATLP